MSSYTADAAIVERGMQILIDALGNVDAERFISIMNRRKDDYDVWRDKYFGKMTAEEYKKELFAFANKQ